MAVAVSSTASSTMTPSATNFTYTALSTGSAAADRVNVAIVANSSSGFGTVPQVTALTINGVSATFVCKRADITDGSNYNSSLEIWWALNTSGTTGNVVVTTDNTTTFADVAIFKVTGSDTTTPFSSSTTAKSANNSTTVAASLVIPTSGGGIGGCWTPDGSASAISWTNLTLATNFADAQGIGRFGSASSTSAGTATRTATVTGITSASINKGLVLAALQIPQTTPTFYGIDPIDDVQQLFIKHRMIGY